MPENVSWMAVAFGLVIICLVLGSLVVAPTSQRSAQATRVFPRTYEGESAVPPAEREVRITRRIGGRNTFGFPLEIHAAGEHIYIIDAQPLESNERLLVVDRETGRVLHRAARRGEGPGELMASISLGTFPGPSPHLSMFDYIRGRVTLYAVDPWRAEPVRFFVKDDYGPQGRSLLWLSDTKAVMNGFAADHLLRFYEVEESPQDGLSARLHFTATAGVSIFPDAPQHAQGNLNLNQIDVRPDRERIVVAFVKASRLVIFDTAGGEMAVGQGPEVETWILPNGERADRLAEMAYRDVAVSQEHIYGLFVGYPEGGEDPARIIHVYNWEGNLVDMIRLEEGVAFIDVEPVSGRLYGTTLDPYPVILEYDLGTS